MESLGGLDDATKNTEDTVVSLEEKKERKKTGIKVAML